MQQETEGSLQRGIADRGELQLQNDQKQRLKHKVMLDHNFKGSCKGKKIVIIIIIT